MDNASLGVTSVQGVQRRALVWVIGFIYALTRVR
jgi:hypothetical protein